MGKCEELRERVSIGAPLFLVCNLPEPRFWIASRLRLSLQTSGEKPRLATPIHTWACYSTGYQKHACNPVCSLARRRPRYRTEAIRFRIQLSSASYLEFGKNIGQVELHSRFLNSEPLGNLLVRKALLGEFPDFAFP